MSSLKIGRKGSRSTLLKVKLKTRKKLIYSCKIYKMSLSIHLTPEGQLSQPPTAITCQDLTERNASLLVSGELKNGHYDADLPV
jgi:hypothetical protein